MRKRGRRRRGSGAGGGRLRNALPVFVFAVVLLIYTMSNAPFEDKDGTAAVFGGIGTLAERVREMGARAGETRSDEAEADGIESDGEPADEVKSDGDQSGAAAGTVTLEELSAASSQKIRVLAEDTGEVKEVPLEEYTACVVASEMPSEFESEALKAQAVAARTYAAARKQEYESGKCAHYDEGAYVCSTTHCQVYRDEARLREIKGDQWMEENFPKILNAVGNTRGEVLYYDGALVEQPLFFSSSGNKTENSEDVFVSVIPYLRSVESGAYEEESPHKDVKTVLTMEELKGKVAAAYGAQAAQSVSGGTIWIEGRTDGGAVAAMRLGTLELTGRQVRSLCGLPSADFEVSVEADAVTFTTSGSGHRVGLSQYGANGMAKQGKNYKEILSHYYSGVEVKKI